MRFAFGFAVVTLLVTTACSDSPEPAPTAILEESPTATIQISPTVPPSATANPAGTPVPAVAEIIDAQSGTVTRIYESLSDGIYGAAWDGDTVELSAGPGSLRLRPDGSKSTAPQNSVQCKQAADEISVLGKNYAGFSCGVVSPDGIWMTSRKDAGKLTLPSGYVVPVWDQFVINLLSGETTELQKGLVHCGGCDGRYGPRWSASSRFVIYAELGGDGRRFLSEVATGSTRRIGAGSDISDAPAWAPDRDTVAYSVESSSSVARLEDLDAGTALDLPIAWPVRFDTSGTLLYSPAADPDPKSRATVTTVFDVATMNVVSVLSGAPLQNAIWTNAIAVANTPNGFVAALQNAEGCSGTALYRQGVPAPTCIRDGVEGRVSPDGSRVAIARTEEAMGHAYGPGFESITMVRFKVEVLTTDGSARILGTTTATSFDFSGPLILWDSTGHYLLVCSPYRTGL